MQSRLAKTHENYELYTLLCWRANENIKSINEFEEHFYQLLDRFGYPERYTYSIVTGGSDDIVEALAEYAHEAWSGWMKYMFEKSVPYKPGEVQAKEGALIIPKWAVDRWTRQMNTKYKDLPENEKESDREEAYIILRIIGKMKGWL